MLRVQVGRKTLYVRTSVDESLAPWSTLNSNPFGLWMSQGRNKDRKPPCQHPTLVLLLRYHFIVPTLRDPNMLPYPGTSPVSSAHRLMAAILTTLSHLGWHLYRSCDLSKKSFDKVSRPLRVACTTRPSRQTSRVDGKAASSQTRTGTRGVRTRSFSSIQGRGIGSSSRSLSGNRIGW